MVSAEPAYDIFISYSLASDAVVAERVQRGLQRLAKPWWRRHGMRVFRDQTALTANPGLWSSIAEALDGSRYFVLFACPESAASTWVAREVMHWRARNGSENFLLVLTNGEIVWDDGARDFDWESTTALEEQALAGWFSEEPRYVDMRWARSADRLNLRDGRFRAQMAELAAPVSGVQVDQLNDEAVREHRRGIRHALSAAVGFVILLIALFAVSFHLLSEVHDAHSETSAAAAAAQSAQALAIPRVGSASNQFGNDPDTTSWPINFASPQETYPNFWADIAGGGTGKQQGDAYAADWCDSSNGQLATDGCRGIGNAKNNNYTPSGYYYTVDFTSAGTANLQVFDPALVNVGQFCTSAQSNANLAGAAELPKIPGYPQGEVNRTDMRTRFHPVADSSNPADPGWRYCTGDTTFPNSVGNTVVPTTTYTVLKATVPGNVERATRACPPITFPGFNDNVATALSTNRPVNFAKYFRQWSTLCDVTGAKGDQYFIEVQTDKGAGSNHFALRAVNGADAAQVTIAGNTYMSMYANIGSNQLTKFYLVRVQSAAKGRTRLLNFYDIADADSVGSLRVVPPADSNVRGGRLSGCQWTGNASSGAVGFASNTPNAPWGPLTPIANCELRGINAPSSAKWNAQWSTVLIPIPSSYSCNDTDPRGCWLTSDYLFAGAVHDNWSWSAALSSDQGP